MALQPPTDAECRRVDQDGATVVWVGPDPYGERIVRHEWESDGVAGVYFWRERWEDCRCPDCTKDAHWLSVGGGPAFVDALPADVRRRAADYPAREFVETMARKVEAHERGAGDGVHG